MSSDLLLLVPVVAASGALLVAAEAGRAVRRRWRARRAVRRRLADLAVRRGAPVDPPADEEVAA